MNFMKLIPYENIMKIEISAKFKTTNAIKLQPSLVLILIAIGDLNTKNIAAVVNSIISFRKLRKFVKQPLNGLIIS